MPARDVYHDLVVRALEEDGWTITADPLRLTYGQRDFYVDLAAENATIAADRGDRKIAVEIKSLGDRSPMRAFEQAIGQFVVYRMILQEHEPERRLYLATPEAMYQSLLTDGLGELAARHLGLCLFTFDLSTERIVQWID
jgi:hypothetical protein